MLSKSGPLPMKRQRAEISSNVISHIKSAHPIEMYRSNKLGIKEKVSRGNFPRLIFSCPVPSGLPHRSHCVPMNMNPSISEGFGPRWETRTPGLMVPNLCLNLQAELSRTLWRFPSLLRFLFETLLPCLFQTQLSSFGICVGLNSVY